jgi:hypothetical protein
MVGFSVGLYVGASVGSRVGSTVGAVGVYVGRADGSRLGVDVSLNAEHFTTIAMSIMKLYISLPFNFILLDV